MTDAVIRPDLTERTTIAVREALSGRRRGLRAALPLAGPAVIASVAYMDPGNYATNIQAGAAYGYQLLWVVVLANLIAVIFQSQSAKLGIVTNRNLAELCRERFPRPLVIAMWIVSEAAAMATDLAELLGGGLGLALLLHLPLMTGVAIAAAATYAILMTQNRGFRPIELVIGGLVAVVAASYVAEVLIAAPDWGAAAFHSVVPQLADRGAVTLSVGIVGATVMPHAIYLHSSLTQARAPARDDGERRRLLRFSNREVAAALIVAGAVNMAMLMVAASAFHAEHGDVAEIETAYRMLTPLLGAASASIFLISLTASGVSSSVVGTMAGQVVMQGFVGFRIPIWVRRAVTMTPAFVVAGLGYDATRSLVISQVVLSLALPVPMIALLWLVRRPDVMGAYATRGATLVAACCATAAVLALNAILLLQTVGAPLPFLAE
jgi:manganese transport protein